MKTTGNSWLVKLFIEANIFAIFVMSWDILSGYTGQENFGHHFFVGVGAFLIGLFTVAFVKPATVDGVQMAAILGFKLPSYLLIIFAGILAALFGVFLGIPCLKLSGPFLALATLSMGLIFHEFVDKILPGLSPMLKAHTTEGIRSIPKLVSSQYTFYYLLLGVLLVSLVLIYTFSRSHYGLVLRAIKEDEPAAKAMGISTTFYKVATFSMAAFFAGVAGAFMAYSLGAISPADVESSTTLKIISMCIVGGMGTISGSFGGAYFLILLMFALKEIARFLTSITGIAAIKTVFVEFEDVFYYGAIVLVLLFMPKGIIATVTKKLAEKPLLKRLGSVFKKEGGAN
jgi:branched-chain amino acid transport system permease protein